MPERDSRQVQVQLLPGAPSLRVRSVRKGGIPQLSNPRDFDRPMPCQTPTAPTSVESHPNVEERDVRMGHPATTGPLVPGKMGKNGDQIQRLFGSPAQVFFVQYEEEI